MGFLCCEVNEGETYACTIDQSVVSSTSTQTSALRRNSSPIESYSPQHYSEEQNTSQSSIELDPNSNSIMKHNSNNPKFQNLSNATRHTEPSWVYSNVGNSDLKPMRTTTSTNLDTSNGESGSKWHIAVPLLFAVALLTSIAIYLIRKRARRQPSHREIRPATAASSACPHITQELDAAFKAHLGPVNGRSGYWAPYGAGASWGSPRGEAFQDEAPPQFEDAITEEDAPPSFEELVAAGIVDPNDTGVNGQTPQDRLA